MKKEAKLTAALLIAANNLVFAQANNTDFMRSVGKIYVVVAVIIAIFIGIVLFLIYLDRRLTKLENQIDQHD